MKDAMTKKMIETQLLLESGGASNDIEEGSTTVEYAIGAIATAGFAGLLIAVLKSGGVKALITSIIQSALTL